MKSKKMYQRDFRKFSFTSRITILCLKSKRKERHHFATVKQILTKFKNERKHFKAKWVH